MIVNDDITLLIPLKVKTNVSTKIKSSLSRSTKVSKVVEISPIINKSITMTVTI